MYIGVINFEKQYSATGGADRLNDCVKGMMVLAQNSYIYTTPGLSACAESAPIVGSSSCAWASQD